MKPKYILAIYSCLVLFATPGLTQQILSPIPTFAVGQPAEVRAFEAARNCNSTTGNIGSCRPNLITGFELNSPHGVAVDLSSGAVYVADTGNNRVLGWSNINGLASGAKADIVVGQIDLLTANVGGPGSSEQALRRSGLRQPTAVAVNSNGDLFVADAGNNRILRYRQPFSQPEGLKLASQVIGQPNFSANAPNTGGLSASTLDTTIGSTSVFRTALAFDGEGNLWFTDADNNRVLRYASDSVTDGAPDGPAANLVIGQPDFQSNNAVGRNQNNRLLKQGMRAPSAVAVDPGGRLFVADELNRVLVYEGPFTNGQDASRIMGIIIVPQGQQPPPPINERTLGVIVGNTWRPPEGIFFIGNVPMVVDTPANRILRYPPYDEWAPEEPTTISPAAEAVIGQDSLRSDVIVIHRGKAEPANNSFFEPVGAAVGPGNAVLVADSGNHRALIFPDLSTGPATSPVAPYAAHTVLGQPAFANRSPNLIEGREFFFAGSAITAADIVIDWNSDPPHMYVADTNNNRILGFADARRVRNGSFADIVIGQPGLFRSIGNFPIGERSETGLLLPVGVELDPQGNLYVADFGNARVLRFPRPFDQGPGLQSADLVLGQESFTSRNTDPTQRTMAAPWGIRFTVEGNLLVSDSVHHRLLLFEGPFENGMSASRVIGQPDFFSVDPGNALNRFNSPRGLGSDTSDRVYVADAGNNRVLVFGDIRQAPNDPTAALSLGGLRSPLDVYVSAATGKAWVANTNSNRNQVLRYPQFDTLLIGGTSPEFSLNVAGPLALTEDAAQNLYVADVINRVVGYFPFHAATNAANYLLRLAPGQITSLFFSEDPSIPLTAAATVPLPTELAGISVLVDGTPAPLYFVSSTQVNFQMPNGAPESGLVEITIIRVSTRQIIAHSVVQMVPASPGLFTRPPTGTGQIAALNQDNSINSSDNPAMIEEVIQIFATGAGQIPGAPQDGVPASGLINTPIAPRVFIGAREAQVQFSGLAPGLVGVWQINVVIPQQTAAGNARLVVIMREQASVDPNNPNAIFTTIAVRR